MDRAVLTCILGMGMLTLARRSTRVRRVLAANAPILVYFGYCLLSTIWSDFPEVAFKRWFRAIGDLVMVLVILTESNWVAAARKVFTSLAFVLLPLSVLFIRYYPELGRAYGQDGSRYWTGVAAGKNGLGMICLILGVALVWRWLVEYHAMRGAERTRRLLALTITTTSALWLLWISDSKTSLACLVLVTGLVAVTAGLSWTRSSIVLHTIVFFLVSTCVSVLFLGVGSSALETMGRDASLTGRTDVWNLVLRFTENPLIGAGYESFWLGERLQSIIRLNGGINQAHNGYIEVYLNLGWVGLSLLAAAVVSGYANVVRSFRNNPQTSMLRLAYVVVALIYNCTEGAFKMMSPVWISCLLALMARPATAAVTRHRGLPDRPLRHLEEYHAGLYT